MKKKVTVEVKWMKSPQDHDYAAAENYLSLAYSEEDSEFYANKLRTSNMTSFKAKDIFRASGLSLLGVSNSHVKANIKKINAGTAMSPILLVRGQNDKVIIADGYHRMCSVYTFNEDISIPCKIV